MRLTNFLIEVGGFAQTGSAASNTRSTMIAHSTASYSDGIIGGSGAAHVFAFGSFIEEGTNTQQIMFLRSAIAQGALDPLIVTILQHRRPRELFGLRNAPSNTYIQQQ